MCGCVMRIEKVRVGELKKGDEVESSHEKFSKVCPSQHDSQSSAFAAASVAVAT